MKYNLIKQRATHQENFTIINNEILFIRDENNKPVSLEELGLFWRILSLPSEWNLSIDGLAKISGCSDEKITRVLTKLKEWGYIECVECRQENNKFAGTNYRVYETLNTQLWNDEEDETTDIKNEQVNNPLSPASEKAASEDLGCGKTGSGNSGTIKYTIDKESIDKESKNKESKNNNFADDFTKGNLTNNSNEENESMASFSKNDVNIQQETMEKINKVDNKQNRGSNSENSQVISNSSKSVKSVSDMIPKTMDLSEEENKKARAKKKENEEKAKQQDSQDANNREVAKYMQTTNSISKSKLKKDEKMRKAVVDYLEEQFSTTPKLLKALITFTDMYIERRGILTVGTLELLLDDLYKLAYTEEAQLKIVNNSIKKSYTEFYEAVETTSNSLNNLSNSNNKNKKVSIPNSMKKINTEIISDFNKSDIDFENVY